jgi:rhodanese-related sulfurtransferase
MLRKASLIVLVATAMALVANAISPKGIPLFGPLPQPGIEGVGLIGLEDAWQSFERGQEIFVDARSAEQYRKGHIPGAVSLDARRFEERLSSFLALVPLDAPLVVYCDGQGCGSSREVAELLREAGYRNIRLFQGGWEEWVRSGYPRETEAGDETTVSEGQEDDSSTAH